MIETPYDLDAVRALDDVRLIQFLELVYTFGPKVALAWLAMCHGWDSQPRKRPVSRRLLQ